METTNKPEMELKRFKKEVRQAVANYMRSEGCSCCSDVASHTEHQKVLAKLLNVPKYSDGSGYNFSKFQKE
jgi:hypothetical protein